MGFTENFCIDLSGGRRKIINDYAAQEWAKDSKLHIFVTKHNSDIYTFHTKSRTYQKCKSIGFSLFSLLNKLRIGRVRFLVILRYFLNKLMC